MLNVPAEIQTVIKNDATLKNFRVHFPNGERADITNENIVFESVSFTESVCSNDTFKFGLAEASVIEFETVGVENIVGLTIECSMEFKVPSNLVETYGEWYSIPYGVFVIDKCPRNHEDMTHRKIVGYSLLKYIIGKTGMLQKMVLPVPQVYVSTNMLIAHGVGDLSAFTEEEVTPSVISKLPGEECYLFDKDKVAYDFHFRAGSFIQYNLTEEDYSILKLERTNNGTLTNEEFGMQMVELVNSLGLELLYDSNGKKIYNSNEEALRTQSPVLFSPFLEQSKDINNSYYVYYRPTPIEPNVLFPIFKMAENTVCNILALKNVINGGLDKIVDNVWRTVQGFSIPEGSFSYDYNCFGYKENEKSLTVAIKSTLAISNSFIYRRIGTLKDYYSTMYAYSNSYSVKDIVNGIAELNASFVHSERDGSISVEAIDNSNPYQLSLSDVEDNVWWDEYDVSPIGTIRYTFSNPLTGQVESGEYVVNSEAKSIYDLSGNKFLESIDFSIYKATTVAKMTNKNLFYLYTGSESGYTKNNFYFYNGTSWVSGGVYNNVTSIVEFVLDNFFVPNMNYVNFTPVEMDLRGLPFLEAGDAITLTAQDGTVLNSYILNHTIDGVQHLTQSVESVSGEVIK